MWKLTPAIASFCTETWHNGVPRQMQSFNKQSTKPGAVYSATRSTILSKRAGYRLRRRLVSPRVGGALLSLLANFRQVQQCREWPLPGRHFPERALPDARSSNFGLWQFRNRAAVAYINKERGRAAACDSLASCRRPDMHCIITALYAGPRSLAPSLLLLSFSPSFFSSKLWRNSHLSPCHETKRRRNFQAIGFFRM